MKTKLGHLAGWVFALVLGTSAHAGNGLRPVVVAVEPEPGTAYDLTQITVTFSEPVTNVDVTDLLLNGRSVALSVSGVGEVYTFTLSQQPAYGLVQITWDPGQDIRDLDDSPSNRMDENDPANLWQYTLEDATPPTVASLVPLAGTAVRHLTQIEVLFSEPVIGVDAGDLRINGTPATSVSVRGVGRYLFEFDPPSNGVVTVSWEGMAEITDFATPANEFMGGSWTYTLDPSAGLPQVRINEFLASNVNGLKDEDGDASDWIEIWNYGATPVNLGGFALTDDPADPSKWVMPSTNLASGRFLVVFASGKDRRGALVGTNRWHTNFRLNRYGNYLALFNNESPRVALSEFAPEYPEQRNDYSYGYDAAATLKYFIPPTPGASNGVSSIIGMAPKPHLNVERGFFEQPFTLIASCPEPAATLRYTLDGSEPTLTTGEVYTGPLQISNTTVVRLVAFVPNLLPSGAETHTYLFTDQVLRQPNTPPGFPAGSTVFTGYPSDYEMDPEIVTNAPGFVKSSLLALPVLSIAIKNDDMFGPVNGIYTHPEPPAAQRYLWERACSAEFILTNGQTGFQVDCGIRVQGNASRTPVKTPKHPFRLMFRGSYGPGRLEYPLFPGAPQASFDSVVLRAEFNNSWVHWDANQRIRGSRVRDAWTKDTFREMNGLSGHTRYFHLYIDGLYWGVYDFGERIDAEFAAAYLGGTADQYDAIASKPTEAIDGDLVAYNPMVTLARSAGISNPVVYAQLKEQLDLPNFIDYMLLNFYGANNDWGRDGNWNAVRRRVPAGPIKYVPWDGEQLLVLTNDNHVSTSIGNDGWPSDIYPNITNSAEFRLEFADRAHLHLFNGGALTPENSAARWMKWAYAVEPGILAESARWGDYRRDVHQYSGAPYYLYTTNGYWWPEILRLRNTYFPVRGSLFLQQLRSAGLYPNLTAPVFSQQGGRVARGFALSMTATNPIYYTTDGSDPRVYGTGAVSPTALRFTNGLPVVLQATATVKARALSGTNWSALNQATFFIETLNPALSLTEIMYNPVGGDAYEFLELQNAGASALDVSGFSFDGITFIFPVGTILAPGQAVILGASVAPGNWTNRYPGVVVFGRFDGSLANGGEKISILDALGHVIHSVDYDDENGWPTEADGLGYSLEIIDPLGDPDDPANWRASAAPDGTPGTVTPPPGPGRIWINELMAANLTAVTNEGAFPDWVELHNPGTETVDLAGWSLTDSGNPRKFVFPTPTLIAPGNYLVVWCDALTNTTPGLHAGFALDNDGESVFLYDASTSRVDAVTFGPQLTDLTVGRIGDHWQLTRPTPGAANEAVTNLASTIHLVLNEWMANAAPGAPDWIELHNASSAGPVALQGISLGNGRSIFQITSLAFVPPGGFVQFLADEQPGPRHLDFRLSAEGGTIVLYDETATERSRVNYGLQLEGTSQGCLPDGSANVVSFPGTASPGAPNYVRIYTGPILNEIMAKNHGAVRNARGEASDWVELVNTNDFDFYLDGYRLSTDLEEPDQWTFPAGAMIPANDYLIIWFDGSRFASLALEPILNTGHSIDGDSGGVYLSDPLGHVVDAVTFGFQVADLTLGRSSGQWRLLTPTPAADNAAPVSLASPADLHLNEWMANPLAGADWFELFNAAPQPVELSGLFLTDDPSSLGLTKFPMAPLSFIGARSFVKCIADNEPKRGAHHVSFALDAAGETLGIFSPALGVIDTVYFGAQDLDVSEGRLPDGAADIIIPFPASPTPEESNYLPLPNAVINEVLTHADPPVEDAIEVYNPSSVGVRMEGWYLSNSEQDLKKFRIPDGTVLEAGGYVVFYQTQFNAGGPGSFTLSAAHGDTVYLSEADLAGNLSGFRAQARFGAAANGVSLGRYETCSGADLVVLSARSFGADQPATVTEFRGGMGLPNADPVVGPVVITELMYHPPDLGGEDNTLDEYVELHNPGAEEVPLFDLAYPENTWRLRGGVDFELPTVTLPPGGHLLVVGFNPVLDPARLEDFRTRFGVPEDVPVLGPFRGKLDNAGERIELQRPDTPQVPPAPDAGFVPYLLADAVAYGDLPPWPIGGDGDGASLERSQPMAYGNDANNWTAAAPTAGRANAVPPAQPPTIITPPVSRAVSAQSTAVFSVGVCSSRPLTYQWRFNGVPLEGETNAFLRRTNVQTGDAGGYSVVVSNAAGSATSAEATLSLVEPPFLTEHPLTQTAYAGTNLALRAAAEGTEPLRYQWFKNGAVLPDATDALLSFAPISPWDSGSYQVVVSNPSGRATSDVAVVTVVVPVNIAQQPVSQRGPPGTNVTFSVVATGTGTLRYQWWFNGVTALPNATNASLLVSNAQLTDNGSYAVQVSDDVSTLWSSNATLTILVRPVITQQPTNTTVLPGADAVLYIEAYGTQPIGFRWRKDGLTFTNGIILATLTNSTLIVTNVPMNFDLGRFNAYVTNVAGTAPGGGNSSNAVLTVFAPPVILVHPPSQTVNPGTNVTFSVMAAGAPPLRYQWWFDDAPVTGRTNATLTLTNVQTTHDGTYAVVITNRHGTATSQPVVLTVGERRPKLSEPALLPEGGFRLLLEGAMNRNYEIQASTNLADWTTLVTLAYTNGRMPFIDATATNTGQRFYRAVLPAGP